MKKTVLFAAMIAVLSSLSFANSVWHFKSGSRNVGNNEFTSVVVHNKTGGVLEVEGDLLYDDSEALFQKDSIVISCKEKNSNKMQAVYSLNGDQLEVTVGLGQKASSASVSGEVAIVFGVGPHHAPHHRPMGNRPPHHARPPKPEQPNMAKPAKPQPPVEARPQIPEQPKKMRPQNPEQRKKKVRPENPRPRPEGPVEARPQRPDQPPKARPAKPEQPNAARPAKPEQPRAERPAPAPKERPTPPKK